MALDDVFAVTRVNQQNSAGDTFALVIEKFNGMVEGTIQRKSKLQGWVPMENVTGTDTIRVDAVGESTLQVLSNSGATPDGTKNDFSKQTLTVDTVVLARSTFPLIDVFQQNFNKQREVAGEHGKKLAKLWDQAMFIQAAKASLLAESAFDKGAAGAKPAGHFGGSIETLALAGDKTDPAKLYASIARLFVKMMEKDVDPQGDDLIIAVKPAEYMTLFQAEQLIQSDYITSEGNKVNGWTLKGYGVPIINSNDYVSGSNISAHPLSTARNSNAYDADFTKLVATAFSPRALLAGETIPLKSEIFYDNVTKLWFVDAHMSYGATTRRAEYAGSIYIP